MKKTIALFLFIITFSKAHASHIVGGEMTYEFLGFNTATGDRKYRITLRLYRDEHCVDCALMPESVSIGIFDNDTQQQIPGKNRPFKVLNTSVSEAEILQPPCVSNAPHMEYHYGLYVLDVELPDNENGYTASYQTCCRVEPLQNVLNNTDRNQGAGSTYACFIPGKAVLGAGGVNNSPQFTTRISTICAERKFTLDFSATDSDGDQLSYKLLPSFNGGRAQDASDINPDPPSYGSLKYINGFTGEWPLGFNAHINAGTGIISGIAPPAGEYVVNVEITESRNGRLISRHRKDFIVTVSGCDVAGAALLPRYAVCDAFTYSFENMNNSPLNKTYSWDFGNGNTSTEQKPTFIYTDTGIYTVKLIVNNNTECGDSTSAEVRVYPGLKPDFDYSRCSNNPTKFTDLSSARYGSINAWQWDFGDSSMPGKGSSLQNPFYTYPSGGYRNVSLTIQTDKGCVDTVTKQVLILGRPFAGNDTTVVAGQSLQFQASPGTRYQWLPATDLNNPVIGNPVGLYRGNYDSIRYKLLIYSDPDCVDSAFVKVRIFKTAPQVFVPTAFTPNSDGKNDRLKPVAAGMASFDYFRVYNRWGQLVFSSSSDRFGWDGYYKGQLQSTGAFVWMVQGKDYSGKVFFAKGTAMLIR